VYFDQEAEGIQRVVPEDLERSRPGANDNRVSEAGEPLTFSLGLWCGDRDMVDARSARA
jgi:hypothetical protein